MNFFAVSTNTSQVFLIGMSVLLLLLLIFQLIYIFWSREKEKYWERYKKKFRASYSEHLFTFLEGEMDAQTLIHKLTKRTTDISFFLEMLDELTAILKGNMRERLNSLIAHELFYSFYKRKLFSFFKKNQYIACFYFAHLAELDRTVTERLIFLANSIDIKLAYSASKALQSSRKNAIRKQTLLSFFRRKEATELMAVELIYHFYLETGGSRKTIGSALENVLNDKKITADKKKVYVLFIAQHHLFEYSEDLYSRLQKIQLDETTAPFVESLIRAMERLQYTEASAKIREYVNCEFDDVQKAAVKSLATFGGDSNLTFLADHLPQMPFSLQKIIIRELTQNPSPGYKLLSKLMDQNSMFSRNSEQQNQSSDNPEQVPFSYKKSNRTTEHLLQKAANL